MKSHATHVMLTCSKKETAVENFVYIEERCLAILGLIYEVRLPPASQRIEKKIQPCSCPVDDNRKLGNLIFFSNP